MTADAARSDAAEGADPSALGRLLDLSEGEIAVLGQAFVEAASALGIEASPVFEGLRRGEGFGRALGLPPETNELLYARAHQWFAAGRPDRAEALFRALCVLDPQGADYWVGQGVCLRMRGALEAASLAFETAARLRPDWAIPYFHALDLALRRGDLADADRRLAAFDARVGPDVTPSILAEVARLRAAILVRRGRGNAA